MYVHHQALGAPPTCAQVEAWLAAHGWHEEAESGEVWGVWSKRIPLHRGIADGCSRTVDLNVEPADGDGMVLCAVQVGRRIEARDHTAGLWLAVSGICRAEGLAFWRLVPEMRGEVQAPEGRPRATIGDIVHAIRTAPQADSCQHELVEATGRADALKLQLSDARREIDRLRADMAVMGVPGTLAMIRRAAEQLDLARARVVLHVERSLGKLERIAERDPQAHSISTAILELKLLRREVKK